MKTERWVMLCILSLSAVVGWMFRWQTVALHPSGDRPPSAYLVNRWTGEIRYLQDIDWIEVIEIKRRRPSADIKE